MQQQHARPIAAPKLVIDSEVADHRNAKCLVFDPIIRNISRTVRKSRVRMHVERMASEKYCVTPFG